MDVAVSSTSLQFHGRQDEIVAFIADQAAERGLVLLAEKFGPEGWVLNTSAGELANVVKLQGRVDRILLSDHELPAGATTGSLLKGAEYCYFHVGSLTDEGLRESAMGATWERNDVLRKKLWHSVKRKLVGSMCKGADLLDQEGKPFRHVSAHRYTPGAEALFHSGTSLLASAGWNRYAPRLNGIDVPRGPMNGDPL